MFDTILIANRGEIACRVMRTAKAMGYKTVAVYSDADAEAPHTRLADMAVHIGGSAPAESYLLGDKIIRAAKETGAGAIHPGYGFLSENAGFARACTEAGLVFIGPPPEAVEIMGNKARSKRRMLDADVPCIPGYQGEDQSDDTLTSQAKSIGLPVMVKASAGGGGRGMRLVHDAKDLAAAITDARSEAANAFGDDTLLIEKAVMRPRHVEVQVFADTFGNTIHLGERDCSVQRRHQKVLEEAPCPVMTADLRERMGAAAVRAAKDIGYVGAGTVEFLLDADGNFYFLEMNTRLQVEHPVTEMVTGLDLVALQIKVARGETLGLEQSDISLTGHAIEARLYAEDPAEDFLPATGHVELWAPASGDGIRIDSGIETGSDISPFYDPMVAKVIAYGASRTEARTKLIAALEQTRIFGVTTNKPFLTDALAREAFASGEATTAFIAETFTEDDLQGPALSEDDALLAALVLFSQAQKTSVAQALPFPKDWMNWASATPVSTFYQFGQEEEAVTVSLTPSCTHSVTASVNGRAIGTADILSFGDTALTARINGTTRSVAYTLPKASTVSIETERGLFTVTDMNTVYASAADEGGAGVIVAPMHGNLIDVFVSEGDTVSTGQRLAVLEAMKMQHEITADIDGTIETVGAVAGAQVAADTLLFSIAEQEE